MPMVTKLTTVVMCNDEHPLTCCIFTYTRPMAIKNKAIT